MMLLLFHVEALNISKDKICFGIKHSKFYDMKPESQCLVVDSILDVLNRLAKNFIINNSKPTH